jgi:hypothetical protein
MSLHVYTKIELKTYTKIVSNPNELLDVKSAVNFFSYYV